MSYTPTNWQTGDTVTAERLNKMEQGIENANEPFIVTCTPTAQDYSGTMDKTVAEIYAAIQAGRKVIYRIYTGITSYLDAEVTMIFTDSAAYPSINAFFLTNTPFDALVEAYTSTTDDGTKNTYGTIIYPLTPMS